MTTTAEPAPPPARPAMVQGALVDDFPMVAPQVARGRALRITELGEAILRRRCATVVEFGSTQLATLIDDMFATMFVAEGVGLAANQVDVGLRVFVYDCRDDDDLRHVGHIVNPVLDKPLAGRRMLVEGNEGCLSVPGPHAPLPRLDHAVVRGVDMNGEPLVIEGTGYFARCLQHETDHLAGHLYIERLSNRGRKEVLADMAELRPEVMNRRDQRVLALKQIRATAVDDDRPA